MEKQTEKTLRNRLLGVIHIKKKRLRITEEQYRNFLWEFFEVTSASQLYEDGLQAIIRLLDRWDKKPAKRSTSRFIWVLWKQYLCPLLRPEERTDEYLTGLANKAAHTWLEIPDFDVLKPDERYKIIEALKKNGSGKMEVKCHDLEQ